MNSGACRCNSLTSVESASGWTVPGRTAALHVRVMPCGPRRTAASDPSSSSVATAHRAKTLTPTPAFTSSISASVAGT